MFAKRIRQNFPISILPPDLLICLEGKTLTDQHIESAFYPHRSANQQISILPLPPFLAPIRLNGRLARGPSSSGPPNSKQESPRLIGKLPHMVRLVKGARG